MKRRYVTADVFTDIPLQGNPVAVVLDCEGLSTEQMQSIAAEFGYTETTFVFPPRDPSHTAWVRIFTPSREIPFAGHPNIGTAFVLATKAAEAGEPLPDTLVFDEAAGVVPVRQLMEGTTVVGGELVAPEQLSLRSEVAAESVAACLSLDAKDIQVDVHRPIVASVGLPFLIVELRSRDALRRCVPNPVAYKATLPLDGAVSIYAYTRDVVIVAHSYGAAAVAYLFKAVPRARDRTKAVAFTRAGQESEIPNFKASYLGRFPLVSADFWTSDHLSERSRSMDAFSGTRARGTLKMKRT